jgi:hypothetical protein
MDAVGAAVPRRGHERRRRWKDPEGRYRKLLFEARPPLPHLRRDWAHPGRHLRQD